jgi:hypothetical protein
MKQQPNFSDACVSVCKRMVWGATHTTNHTPQKNPYDAYHSTALCGVTIAIGLEGGRERTPIATMSALLACAATLLSFANQPDVHFPSYLPPVECGAKGCAEPGCAIVGAATGKDDGACLASFVPCMPGACTPNRKDSCPQIRRRRALGALQFMVTAIAAWLVLADCMALHMSNNTCIYVCCMQIPWVKSQNHVCTAYKPLTQVMRQDET